MFFESKLKKKSFSASTLSMAGFLLTLSSYDLNAVPAASSSVVNATIGGSKVSFYIPSGQSVSSVTQAYSDSGLSNGYYVYAGKVYYNGGYYSLSSATSAVTPESVSSKSTDVFAGSTDVKEYEKKAEFNNGVVTDAVVSAVAAVKVFTPSTTATSKTDKNDDSNSPVQFKQFNAKETSVERLESVMRVASEQGPVVRSSGNVRVWLSPYTNFNNQSGKNSSKGYIAGSLMGVDYVGSNDKYSVGLVSGFGFGKQEAKADSRNKFDVKALIGGLTGSYKAWENGSVDLAYLRASTTVDEKRFVNVSNQTAANSHKITADIIDLEVSHSFKMSDAWSARVNGGHLYIHEKTGAYTEKDAGINNKRVSAEKARSAEVYLGGSVTWTQRSDSRMSVTGGYEIGQEYSKSASVVNVGHGQNYSYNTSTRKDTGKKTTHYLSAFATFAKDSHWVFSGGYQGSIKKGLVNTGLFVKAAYKF